MQILELLEHADFPEGTAWRRQAYHAGETILAEGEDSRDIYVVLKGTAAVNKEVGLADDRQIQSGLCELSDGDTFGELNLFDDRPRSCSVVARTDMEVARIDGAHLLGFLDRDPLTGYQVMKGLLEGLSIRLRKANERASSLFSWGLRRHGIDIEL